MVYAHCVVEIFLELFPLNLKKMTLQGKYYEGTCTLFCMSILGKNYSKSFLKEETFRQKSDECLLGE